MRACSGVLFAHASCSFSWLRCHYPWLFKRSQWLYSYGDMIIIHTYIHTRTRTHATYTPTHTHTHHTRTKAQTGYTLVITRASAFIPGWASYLCYFIIDFYLLCLSLAASAEELTWGSTDTTKFRAMNFDMIFASECLYNSRYHILTSIVSLLLLEIFQIINVMNQKRKKKKKNKPTVVVLNLFFFLWYKRKNK